MNLEHSFYSNGKLLITGEYLVLDGAKALAIPTKYGQSLTVKITDTPSLKWESLDEKENLWFEHLFTLNDILTNSANSSSDNEVLIRLLQILKASLLLNSNFLVNIFNKNKGLLVTTKLNFPKNWGLGSSSTLLNNIAKWAKIDAFEFSRMTFGGSGYDIACAKNETPIVYTLSNNTHTIEKINFNPKFKSKLFFIHLNQKQNSRNSIKTYRENKINVKNYLTEINDITEALIKTSSLNIFENLIFKHETIIGKITDQIPVKEKLFNDYRYAIKSLGGWGGDFILATGEASYVKSYFTNKGYKTILSFEDMAL